MSAPIARSISYQPQTSYSSRNLYGKVSITKPVVGILRESKEAKTLATQLSSEVSLNYHGEYSRHVVDVHPALIKIDSNNEWNSVMKTISNVIIATFDHTKPESFRKAQEALSLLRNQNPKTKLLCVCFGLSGLSIEDMVYFDIICSENSCLFMVLEKETCGHQLSELFGSFFPQLKLANEYVHKKNSWTKLKSLFSRSKNLAKSFEI